MNAVNEEEFFKKYEVDDWSNFADFKKWVEGSVLSEITVYQYVHEKATEGFDSRVVFVRKDGEVYQMYHGQNCCESVGVDKIYGDVKDLEGQMISSVEEMVFNGHSGESTTFSLYKFGYAKEKNRYIHDVTIQWLGESNGYYSEDVDFYTLKVKS